MDKDEIISIGKDRKEVVERNEHVNIQGHQDLVVNKNQTESIYKNRSLKVQKNNSEHVLENKSVTVNMGFATQVGGVMNTAVGGMQTEEIGEIKETMVGKSYKIDVADKFEIGVGDSTIIMTPDKVVITGMSALIGAEKANTLIGTPMIFNPGKTQKLSELPKSGLFSRRFDLSEIISQEIIKQGVNYKLINHTQNTEFEGQLDHDGRTLRVFADKAEAIELQLLDSVVVEEYEHYDGEHNCENVICLFDVYDGSTLKKNDILNEDDDYNYC